MKKKRLLNLFALSVAMLFVSTFSVFSCNTTKIMKTKNATTTTQRQMESLSRGLVATKNNNGIYLSWRLLGTENYNTTFNVYRNGTKIASNISDSTNYLDTTGSSASKYTVRSVLNGNEITESDIVTPWASNYLDVKIDKPSDVKSGSTTVTYSANDASVADVDGDGEYEIILKWDPSNSQDNSNSGVTSNVYIDCYEMDGTKKWRIDLGKNIRAGAHYTQFIAYDLNGDGKAEIAMKTADGTIAGDGTVIGDKSKDYRNSSGYILSGPEYLTLFEGNTGKILSTIDYTPERGTVSSWGDSYGNRVDRFLAGVAYLDGKTPSLITGRGYYTRIVVCAYKYKSGKLTSEWTFDTNSSGNSAYAGQGNHSLSVADVDGDSCDEIVYGSCVIDNNGKGLYSTGDGHGDALHVGDFDPRHDGLEIFQVHETTSSDIESVQMRDAKTGKTLWCEKLSADIGRGIIANIGADYYPYYVRTSGNHSYDGNGKPITSSAPGISINFTSYWDGDLYQELLDDTEITKWNSSSKKIVELLSESSNVHSNNGSKATPSLSGDILGDWREEAMWPTLDNNALRIYTTDYVTEEKLYTLMSDSQYRTAIAWQNVGYNQPPHPSYYIGVDMETPTQPSMYTVGSYSLNSVGGSGDDGGNNGGNEDDNNGGGSGEVSQLHTYNWTDTSSNSSIISYTGNTSTSKGSVTYKDVTYSTCLKIESSTSIKINTDESMTLNLVSNDGFNGKIKIDGQSYTFVNGFLTIELSNGSHEITKGDSTNLYFIELVKEDVVSDPPSYTDVDVIYSQSGTNSIRFYSIIEGSAANYSKIEFVLSNGTNNATINITSAYYSLNSGYNSQQITAGDNQFIVAAYVTDIPSGINISFVKLVLTNTDGAQRTITNV